MLNKRALLLKFSKFLLTSASVFALGGWLCTGLAGESKLPEKFKKAE